MTDKDSDKTKLLFILSNDYGELFDAMCFVRGLRFDPIFLVPTKLFDLNHASFPYPMHCYNSTNDIQNVVDSEKPSIVFLFSGYLYVMNNILDAAALEKLIAQWRDQKLKVATSDPFLGMMATIKDDTFNNRHPRHEWLTTHFFWLSHLLQDFTHIYHSTLPLKTAKGLSFFNSNIILEPSEMLCHRKQLLDWSPAHGSKDRWLFVLSTEDYGMQMATYGGDRFLEELRRMLNDAIEAGRQPVLMAPEPCIAAMQTKGKHIEDLIALPSCSFTLFMLLLYEAEYVFYWNMFSASIVVRALNRKPFFFFDKGHLARVISSFSAVAMRHFYPDCEIELLQQGNTLTSERLVRLAAAQEEKIFLPAFENFSRSPNPEQIVREIV